MRSRDRFVAVLAVSLLVLSGGCSAKKEELTADKAKELLEASNLFRAQPPVVTLTDEEVQKGLSAGYWTLSAEAEHHRENHQMLLLTPEGRHYFSGQPLVRKPVITVQQNLSGRLLQIEDIQVPGEGATDRVVVYTYTWSFENQLPELAEFFEDQPPQEGKKIFRYGDKGWEILLQ